MKAIHIFIDTMIFLHYKPIEEVDWENILGAEKITIVIPRITIRELDKEKNTHKQKRIREKAKKVLNKIEKWMQNEEPIRPAVNMVYYDSIPNLAFEKYGLNPNWNDDYLLATMLQYKNDNPTTDIYLISQDSGPRLTAQHLGIPVLEMPQELMLPVVVDPTESENLELKRTLAKLQLALPHLVVCFAGSEPPESHAKYYLQSPLKPIDKELEDKLIEIRKKYPKCNQPASKQTNNAGTVTTMAALLAVQSTLLRIQPEEYERYNNDVDKYITSYEQYMRESWRLKEIERRTIQFQIEIRNIGTAPADDVDLYFYFPDGFELQNEDGLQPPPKEPKPPVEPRTQAQIMAESLNMMLRYPGLAIPRPFFQGIRSPSSFSLKRTKSYELTDHAHRIKHGDCMLLPELSLTFDSFETAASFSCEYTIRPANLPEPLMGNLHFIIEKEVDC